MLLHIGEGTLVREKHILGFFDLDGAGGEMTRDFLREKEKEGVTELLTTDIPRSFVLTDEPPARERVYITRLSTTALWGRTEKSEVRNKK